MPDVSRRPPAAHEMNEALRHAWKLGLAGPDDVAGDQLEPGDVLFVGQGSTALGWYRCYLPAMWLGADWVGMVSDPPHMKYVTGVVQGETKAPDFMSYKAVVIQGARGRGWFNLIHTLKRAGVKVIFEVDDYLHGIKNVPGHDSAKFFTKDVLRDVELCMGSADAMICSTEYLSRRYARFNARRFVCRNGLDLARYNLTLPKRDTVNIGWAGATGHVRAVAQWAPAIARVMKRHPETKIVTVGYEYADEFAPMFPGRTLSIPWAMLDQYPAAMTNIDVAVAPVGPGPWYQAKSDLRWLEAGALGIPLVAGMPIYGEIDEGVTGFQAQDVSEAEEALELLVADEKLRLQVGARAREHVTLKRNMRVMSRQWRRALLEVVD